MQADVQRIMDIYHRSGRFDVSVTPQMIERPNNRVDLIFKIDEGEKTGVKSITIIGNKSYSSWRLKEVIKTSESNWLSFLQTTDVYDPDRLEADRDDDGHCQHEPADGQAGPVGEFAQPRGQQDDQQRTRQRRQPQHAQPRHVAHHSRTARIAATNSVAPASMDNA